MISTRQTNQEITAELGRRVRRYRLMAVKPPPSQRSLGAKAGVSEPTIKRLEAGGNATLLSFVAVLRELGLLGNLDQLVPESIEPSPMEMLDKVRPQRQRAARARTGKGSRGGS